MESSISPSHAAATRGIQEKDFGRIQIDRVPEMRKWVDSIKTVENERINLAIVNRHSNSLHSLLVPSLTLEAFGALLNIVPQHGQ